MLKGITANSRAMAAVGRRSVMSGEFRELRRAAGISQTDMAGALCVDFTTVNRWEAGKHRISDKNAEKVAGLLPALQRLAEARRV